MKYFSIDKRIDEILAKEFFEFANSNSQEAWTITIFTVGGMRAFGDSILYVINEHKMIVNLIAVSAYSCGFDIFYNAKCSNKYIFDTSLAMTYLVGAHMKMNSDGKPAYHEDVAIMKNWKDWPMDEFLKWMSMDETELYKKGEEVYFTAKRILEIMPDVKLIRQ